MHFFPSTFLQDIISKTGGCRVEYRGQVALFHHERPSFDDPFTVAGSVQGLARILIGDTKVFPNLERNTLITVDGDDYLVADWTTPNDGGVVYIALKTTTRT